MNRKQNIFVAISLLTIFIITLGSTLFLFSQFNSINSLKVHTNSDSTSAFRNVRIEGMGFITGVINHPNVSGLTYIRTDVGGVYRQDTSGGQWVPLMDSFTPFDFPGVDIESFAIDPNNNDTIYAAIGSGYSDLSDIYKSTDRGETWLDLNVSSTSGVIPRMAGNDVLRGAGERLYVDPQNSDTLYFGSRNDGLFVSRDGGATWVVNNTVPLGSESLGITFSLVDG